jgi:hypothetical protein
MTTRQTSSCSLSNFAPLLASTQVPHNQAAKRIFVSNFLRAAHAKVYSIQCIGGGLLNEEKVGRAFEHALKVQIQLQKIYNDRQDEQGIHHQQKSAAIKIGVCPFPLKSFLLTNATQKWLMLHQVFWLSEENRMAGLIGKIGPGLCSSDESDANTDGVGRNGQSHTSQRKSRKIPLRSPEFAAFMDSIRRGGLYYGKNSTLHKDPTNSDDITYCQPPPDGMPFAWISEEYMVDIMHIG